MRFGLRPLTAVDLVIFALIVIMVGSLCAFAAIGMTTVFGW